MSLDEKEEISIIGAGPSGLFCSYLLLQKGYKVNLYDQSSGVGKKFLVAGNGGLNLTHSESLDVFCRKYGENEEIFKELLSDFSPDDLRAWCNDIGVETFIGSSRRVFPKKMNAAEILLNWTHELKKNKNFNLFIKHQFVEYADYKKLVFKHEEKEIIIKPDRIIFALGGASWKKTGSDGKWFQLLEKKKIKLSPFLPMNCGFERSWSKHFIKTVDRSPLKNIEIHIEGEREHTIRGELMITPFGIEGGAIYAISNRVRDKILQLGKVVVVIDLKPDLKACDILAKLERKKNKTSLSNHLRKSLGLNKAMIALINELSKGERDNNYLSSNIKSLKLELDGIRPIDEAISTSGGVCFSELTSNLELKKNSGIYFVGEMLDFEAPTGGYLLQACFSSAWRVVKSITS